MKFQIILLILAAIASCSLSEKVKGHRSNIRIEDFSENLKHKPATARFFHKKGGSGGQSQPTILLVQIPTATAGTASNPTTITASVSGELEVTPVTDETRGFMERYEDDDDDFVDDSEQITRRNKNQNKKLKLKKISGKKYAKSRRT